MGWYPCDRCGTEDPPCGPCTDTVPPEWSLVLSGVTPASGCCDGYNTTFVLPYDSSYTDGDGYDHCIWGWTKCCVDVDCGSNQTPTDIGCCQSSYEYTCPGGPFPPPPIEDWEIEFHTIVLDWFETAGGIRGEVRMAIRFYKPSPGFSCEFNPTANLIWECVDTIPTDGDCDNYPTLTFDWYGYGPFPIPTLSPAFCDFTSSSWEVSPVP